MLFLAFMPERPMKIQLNYERTSQIKKRISLVVILDPQTNSMTERFRQWTKRSGGWARNH
jgi:hypothetical protein